MVHLGCTVDVFLFFCSVWFDPVDFCLISWLSVTVILVGCWPGAGDARMFAGLLLCNSSCVFRGFGSSL